MPVKHMFDYLTMASSDLILICSFVHVCALACVSYNKTIGAFFFGFNIRIIQPSKVMFTSQVDKF